MGHTPTCARTRWPRAPQLSLRAPRKFLSALDAPLSRALAPRGALVLAGGSVATSLAALRAHASQWVWCVAAWAPGFGGLVAGVNTPPGPQSGTDSVPGEVLLATACCVVVCTTRPAASLKQGGQQ